MAGRRDKREISEPARKIAEGEGGRVSGAPGARDKEGSSGTSVSETVLSEKTRTRKEFKNDPMAPDG